MGVYLQVTAGLYLKVQQCVAGDLLQHVVEKRHAGLHRGTAVTVQVECHRDLGLAGLAGDGLFACTHRRKVCFKVASMNAPVYQYMS